LSMILARELSKCRSVLELGCGHRSLLHLCNVPFSVGVESREPYLQETIRRGIHSQYIRADVGTVEFAPKSFDAVLGLNLFCHVAGREATELLCKMEQWARKKVILTTPNGYRGSDTLASSKNQMEGLESGWDVDTLRARGFKVHGFGGSVPLRPFPRLRKITRLESFPRLLKVMSPFSYEIAYHCPRTAQQLIAVKSIDQCLG